MSLPPSIDVGSVAPAVLIGLVPAAFLLLFMFLAPSARRRSLKWDRLRWLVMLTALAGAALLCAGLAVDRMHQPKSSQSAATWVLIYWLWAASLGLNFIRCLREGPKPAGAADAPTGAGTPQ